MDRVHFSSRSDEWGTPQEFFDKLHDEFNFVLDAAASRANAKCKRFFFKDALKKDWALTAKIQREDHTGAVWLNPPYGRQIGKWVAKARATAEQGTTVVCLLPARTDTRWWHEYIWDTRFNTHRDGVEIRLLRGRLKFEGAKYGAPFLSAVVVFRGEQ